MVLVPSGGDDHKGEPANTSPPPGGLPMAERPQPAVDRFLQVTIPPEDAAEHSGYARLLIDYIEGRPPPASAKQPRVTRKLRAWAELVKQVAQDFAAQQSAVACAMPNPVTPPIVALPQNPASSAERWITTADAAAISGLTQQTIRNYADRGAFRNGRFGRMRIIHHGDFGAWWNDMRGVHGAGSGEDGSPGGEPGRAGGGGAAGRGAAA
jgi:hypothetical protein